MGREARILEPFRMSQRRAERPPRGRVLDAHRDPAIRIRFLARTGIYAMWRGVLGAVTVPRRHRTVQRELEQRRSQEVERGLELRDVEVLPFARPALVIDGGQQRRG